MPKQVTTGRSAAAMIVNITGCATLTNGWAWSSAATSSGTLLKNRSDTFFSNTTICESLRRMRSNIFTAPPNTPTTLSMVATPSAMPVAPMAVRTRCRRRLVKIMRHKLMEDSGWRTGRRSTSGRDCRRVRAGESSRQRHAQQF